MRRVGSDGYRGLSCGRVGSKQRKHLRLRVSELVYPEYYSRVKSHQSQEGRQGGSHRDWMGCSIPGGEVYHREGRHEHGETRTNAGFHEYTQYVDKT